MISARDEAKLQAVAGEYAQDQQVMIAPLDVTDHASISAAHADLLRVWGGVDLVLVVAGSYNAMRAATFDLALARGLVELNLMGVLNCLDVVLPNLLQQGTGGIALVASVAGYRGLPKALVYGPSKAAVINLAESLYCDLHPQGFGVYLINPGFVDTRLTAANDFPMPGLMRADDAAAVMMAGIARGDFHIHFPRRFTNWLRLARLLPYRCYFWLVRHITGL